jgi:hypothetical protein
LQAASAAWNMGNWDEMEKYIQCLDEGVDTQVHMPTLNTSGSGNGASDGAFFRAVLCVRRSADSLSNAVSIISDVVYRYLGFLFMVPLNCYILDKSLGIYCVDF